MHGDAEVCYMPQSSQLATSRHSSSRAPTSDPRRAKRKVGKKPKKNAGELAIVDFMTSDDGMSKYVATGEPVAILFEDAGIRIFNKPPNLYLLSTVGMLRGFERVGIIDSADKIIHEMTHPSKPDRRPANARVFTDLPAGIDEPAAIGSSWTPGNR
jgi:hypothetical protein